MTFIGNGDEQHEDDNEDAQQSLLAHDHYDSSFLTSPTTTSLETNEKKKQKRRRKNAQTSLQSSSSFFLQKRLINLRSVLLALSLSLILMVFWLLDSLKDPNFAILVNGDLQRHQPLAKMASVGGTLILVICMEVISHGRQKNSENNKSKPEEDVLSGGGRWTKMGIASAYDDTTTTSITAKSDSQAIPISTFTTVGIAYIIAFGIISYLLSQNPLFQHNDNNNNNHYNPNNVAWYILGYIQYICIESYGSISVATFWSYANSTLTLKAAKAFYGFIIAMAQIGAIGGSTLATFQGLTTPALICVACFGIVLQMGVMYIYGYYFPYAMVGGEDDAVLEHNDNAGEFDFEAKLEEEARGARKRRQRAIALKQKEQQKPSNFQIQEQGSDTSEGMMNSKVFLSGLRLILKHDYLLLILGVSCLYEIALTCLDYEMKLIGLDRFSSPSFGNTETQYYYFIEKEEDDMEDTGGTDAEITHGTFALFMGRYGQLTNVLSLFLSYYAFPYLMEHFGLKHTLRIFPSLLLGITLMAFVALPMNLPVLFVSMSLLKAMTYSINDPAKEILYIPTSNTVKFKAKFWIDVVGARIAKALGSSINTYAGTAERVVQYGSLPSVLSALALWVICYAAGMEFDSLLRRGDIVGIEEEEDDSLELHLNNVTSEDDNDYIENTTSNDSGWESNVSIELVSRLD